MRRLRVPKCGNMTPDFADLSLTQKSTTQSPRLLKQVQRGPTGWVCVGPRMTGPLIEASSLWRMVDRAEATPGLSGARFLLLPGVRGEWRARQVYVPQVDGGRGRHLPRPLCCSRHERGHPCDVPEGRAMRAGWWGPLWPAQGAHAPEGQISLHM